MKVKLIVFLLVLIFDAIVVHAQTKKKVMSAGFGLGLHYGGIGFNISAAPIKYLAIEAGAGYNLVGVGLNGGAAFRILPDKRVCPDVGFLYGYNAAIRVENLPDSSQTYYGFSLATGIKIWNKVHTHFLNLQFLLPFRTDEYEQDLLRYEVKSKPLDFAFSIGYHL